MGTVSGLHLGGELSKLLGLKQCVSFSIHFEMERCVYINANLLMPDEATNELVEVMKRYTLIEEEAPEEDDEPGGDIDWGDGGPLSAS